jgi:hypothetical protein
MHTHNSILLEGRCLKQHRLLWQQQSSIRCMLFYAMLSRTGAVSICAQASRNLQAGLYQILPLERDSVRGA